MRFIYQFPVKPELTPPLGSTLDVFSPISYAPQRQGSFVCFVLFPTNQPAGFLRAGVVFILCSLSSTRT